MIPINDTWSKLRISEEQTIQLMIKCVRDDVKDNELFYKPPINQVTLSFNSSKLEEEYRDHYVDYEHSKNMLSSRST